MPETVAAIHDTKLAQNYICKNMLLMPWVPKVKLMRAKIWLASDSIYTIKGVVHHYVTIEWSMALTAFGIVLKVAIRTLTRAAFFNDKTTWIETNCQPGLPWTAHAVTIAKWFGGSDVVQLYLSANNQNRNSF